MHVYWRCEPHTLTMLLFFSSHNGRLEPGGTLWRCTRSGWFTCDKWTYWCVLRMGLHCNKSIHLYNTGTMPCYITNKQNQSKIKNALNYRFTSFSYNFFELFYFSFSKTKTFVIFLFIEYFWTFLMVHWFAWIVDDCIRGCHCRCCFCAGLLIRIHGLHLILLGNRRRNFSIMAYGNVGREIRCGFDRRVCRHRVNLLFDRHNTVGFQLNDFGRREWCRRLR